MNIIQSIIYKKCALCGTKNEDVDKLDDNLGNFAIALATKSEEYSMENFHENFYANMEVIHKYHKLLFDFFIGQGLDSNKCYCQECLGKILEANDIEWR